MDSGDLLLPIPIQPNEASRKLAGLKADLYVKAYNFMKYDAFTPGEIDLSFGVEALKEKSKAAKFPFLAANLMEDSSGKPVFSTHLVKEVNGIKVGLMGLISDRVHVEWPSEEKGKYRLSDPIAAARKAVAALKKQNCRIIVAIAHMPAEEQEGLAFAIPEIDFILGGHDRNYQIIPMKANNAQILMAGSRGENLGRVDLALEEKTPIFRYRLIALTDKFSDHTGIQDLVRQYKAEVQNLFQPSPAGGSQ